MQKQVYYIYILECNNGKYYTGYTTDMSRRYKEHRQGSQKSKFTRAFRPVQLAQCWEIRASKSVALRIEYYIKTKNRKEKMGLVTQPDLLKKNIQDELQLEVNIGVFDPGIIEEGLE